MEVIEWDKEVEDQAKHKEEDHHTNNHRISTIKVLQGKDTVYWTQ